MRDDDCAIGETGVDVSAVADVRPAAGRRAVPYRIGVLLMALAVLPLTGAAWFAIGEVTTAQTDRAQAAQVDASVTRLVLLTELKARLLDELNWTSARASMANFGLNDDLVLRLTGLDITSEADAASARVDELVATLGLVGLADSLAAARTELGDMPAPASTPATTAGSTGRSAW